MQLSSTRNATPAPAVSTRPLGRVIRTGWPFRVLPSGIAERAQMQLRIARLLAVTRRQWWPPDD